MRISPYQVESTAEVGGTCQLIRCSSIVSKTVCGYCGGPHEVSLAVFEEQPFCSGCLDERVRMREVTLR